jgi:hypothetical protein
MENSLWKRLLTCRKTDNGMNERKNERVYACFWIQRLFLTVTNVTNNSFLRRKLCQARAVAERCVEVIQGIVRFLYWVTHVICCPPNTCVTSYHQNACCDMTSTLIPTLSDISALNTPPKDDTQGRAMVEVVCRRQARRWPGFDPSPVQVWSVMDRVTLRYVSEYVVFRGQNHSPCAPRSCKHQHRCMISAIEGVSSRKLLKSEVPNYNP